MVPLLSGKALPFVALMLAPIFAHAQDFKPAISAQKTASRRFYAVNESSGNRGTISVYDIDHAHKLLYTIATVSDIGDVRGVAVSAVTSRLYVSYNATDGTGMVYCLDLISEKIVWNLPIPPNVDRLSIRPDGQVLYVPTSEITDADFINVVDANTGSVIRTVVVSNHSHDTLYPLSGPVFQETKATDGSGRYLYRIDPVTYAVSQTGPYLDILGPYSVGGSGRFVVDNVYGIYGMQVADLTTGKIITAIVPHHPSGNPGLLHGIGWTPSQTEVWECGVNSNVYVWNMSHPMAPVLKQTLPVSVGGAPHWITFTIKGDYAYVAPDKNSSSGTEIFSVASHSSVGTIASSEDMLEIDFSASGAITAVGNQFGIGRL